MFDYDWPGNIREMENTIERSLILTENDKIEAEDLPPHIRALSNAALNISNDGQLNTENTLPFEKIKELAIRNAIKVTKGNIFEAAKKLELGRATIYRLMAKYNIDPENP
ncbi:MAG: hypothetical protein B6D45_10040 [Ignavibacteriales bacterium UTCHB3]|nr:MAG: hypothetical protein B6D45_10040 [Ignavibacteriales bacterium UTCHB3]